jgi:acetylornithine aminotransferase
MNDHLMNTYAPLSVAFVRGEGAWLWDEDGKRYLDAISGLGVCSLGHAHPALARVIADQAATLVHTGNLVRIPWQEQLAGRLACFTGMDRVFFGNSGAEAVECALKITRLIGHERGQARPGVIVMEHGFHGRTMAALSATGSRKAQAGFEPLVAGFVRAPFGDLVAVRAIARRSQDIAAVLVEPIQGEAGIRIPPPGYLAALRAICDEHGWLLICDEIQSGLCRSGRWYAHQHEEIVPDMVTTAKALAKGPALPGARPPRRCRQGATGPRSEEIRWFRGPPAPCWTSCTKKTWPAVPRSPAAPCWSGSRPASPRTAASGRFAAGA